MTTESPYMTKDDILAAYDVSERTVDRWCARRSIVAVPYPKGRVNPKRYRRGDVVEAFRATEATPQYRLRRK